MGYTEDQEQRITRRAEAAGIDWKGIKEISVEATGRDDWYNLSKGLKAAFEDALDVAIGARVAVESATVESITATPQAPAAQSEPMATDRQVAYIAKLLARAWAWGLEPRLERLMSDDRPNRDAIAALTRREASATIDLLREQY